MADKLLFLVRGQKRELVLCTFARGDTVLCQSLEYAANTRVGVLNIINGVLVVLTDRQIEVKVHLSVGLSCVEEETRAVNGNLLEKIAELDRLAGTLAHLNKLAVTHELNELHKHDVELVAVVADGVHSALHPHNVAVVVGAPNVDKSFKSAVKFILVIRDIRGKIGRVAVLADKHVVL